ncbi:MAG: OmpA family protein [Phycisphaerales bacterium]|jgi:chemotaxis protein MotB|nr:OmpA family protein [Phycisphaerales bacterium]
MASKEKQPDEGPEIPAWIVSFTDMITLLLAFFVLLQAFAVEQDPELFRQGQGGFRRSIAGFGIPDLLFGKVEKISGDARKTRYPTDEDTIQKNRQRVIDSKDDKIRKAYELMAQVVEIKTSENNVDVRNEISTPISFEPGVALLDDAARAYLRSVGEENARLLNPKKVRFCVIGSAMDQPAGKERWLLSAARAQAASEYMRDVMSNVSQGPWMIRPLGSGAEPPPDPKRTEPVRQEFVRIAIIGVQ